MNDFTKALRFDEASHIYTVNGKSIPSVTEIISPMSASKYTERTAALEFAAARGTAVHQLCQMYDLGLIDIDSEEPIDGLYSETAPYLQAWVRFCEDYSPTWEYIEVPLARRDEYGEYAGTVDRIGLIDGTRFVVDIKTTSSMDKISKMSLVSQLYGYKRLAEANGIEISADDAFGVQLRKDGGYRLYKTRKIQMDYGFYAADLWATLRKLNTFIYKFKEKNNGRT